MRAEVVPGAGEPTIDAIDSARRVQDALADKKGRDILSLDVRGLSGVTDVYVIATGTSSPHLKALASEVERVFKAEGRHHRRAGTPESGWITVDLLDVVVHIMTAERRTYYALEELWRDAPRLS